MRNQCHPTSPEISLPSSKYERRMLSNERSTAQTFGMTECKCRGERGSDFACPYVHGEGLDRRSRRCMLAIGRRPQTLMRLSAVECDAAR